MLSDLDANIYNKQQKEETQLLFFFSKPIIIRSPLYLLATLKTHNILR